MLCVLLGAALLTACAGAGGLSSSAPEIARQGQRLAPPVLMNAAGKSASGAPMGIWTTWTRDASGLAQGYYLYRDTNSIPDPPPGNGLDPALRVNGGGMIAQPPLGAEVTFNDIFAVVIGQTYYYRVTVVDDLDQETDPSNEVSWTAHGHTVAGVAPLTVAWGDSVTITGDTFGDYNAATDSVKFPQAGGGEVDGIIQAPADWTPSQIVVTVPEMAVTGKLKVVIDSTIAESDDVLTVLNPYILSLSPNPGFLQRQLTVDGGNFGATRGTSTVAIGGVNVSTAVTSWSDAQIKLTVPAGASAGGDVIVTKGGHPSNALAWTPRPEILSADPGTVQSGEMVLLSGRLFTDAPGQVLLDGTTPVSVLTWQDSQIIITLSAAPGSHTLTARTTQPLDSNSFLYTVEPPLGVTLSGLSAGTVYRPASPPNIGVATAADADEVRLVIDGSEVDSVTAPFTGLTLPVASLTNGVHRVKLRALRRAVTADSAQLDITIYSLEGDIDGDGVVGSSDVAALGLYIGLKAADAGFQPWYNTDADGVVTEADTSLVGYNFGNSIPALP